MIIEGAVDTALAAYLDAHGQPKAVGEHFTNPLLTLSTQQ